MQKYLSVGFGFQAGSERSAPAIRDATRLQHDERMQARGAIIGIAGLPAQVRDHGRATMEIFEGLLPTAILPLAGFALIEAQSFKRAFDIALKTLREVAYGPVQARPEEQVK